MIKKFNHVFLIKLHDVTHTNHNKWTFEYPVTCFHRAFRSLRSQFHCSPLLPSILVKLSWHEANLCLPHTSARHFSVPNLLKAVSYHNRKARTQNCEQPPWFCTYYLVLTNSVSCLHPLDNLTLLRPCFWQSCFHSNSHSVSPTFLFPHHLDDDGPFHNDHIAAPLCSIKYPKYATWKSLQQRRPFFQQTQCSTTFSSSNSWYLQIEHLLNNDGPFSTNALLHHFTSIKICICISYNISKTTAVTSTTTFLHHFASLFYRPLWLGPISTTTEVFQRPHPCTALYR